MRFADPVPALIFGAYSAVLVLLLATDLDQRLLPNEFTLPAIPIVLLSGLTPDPEVSSLADAVLIKPFEPAALLAAIRGSLGVTGPE